MREIEFRGKRRDNGEWAYGDLTHLAYEIAAINDDIVVDDKTVGQHTGLKDRNGVKIFEGDVVRDKYGNIGAVRYSDHFLDWRIHFYKGRPDLLEYQGFGLKIFDWVYPEMLVEVIGNIHDNPELLGRE
jgi:uncharacterized phage protein (TIGR01671 family)